MTDMPSIAESKALVRQQMRAFLHSLMARERDERSARIIAQLKDREELRSGPVMTFASMPRETNLDGLWDLNLDLVFPKVDMREHRLDLYRATSWEDFAPGVMGIREPVPERCEVVGIEDVATILVPGLAFDPVDRMRLGRGGGFYDRLLGKFRGITIGICYAEQLVKGIPREDHDRPVQALVTDA